MDAIFSLLSEADRTRYLQSLMQSFGCTYICLWLYFPPPNHRLYFLDGHFNEENNQPGPSSGSLARRLFDEYRRQGFDVLNDHIPGMAFINNQSYRELNQSELLKLASVVVQRQFYQEARIKAALFMGCRSGEIEMGWSNANQINKENVMMNWFSEYNISQQSQLREVTVLDPNRPSSSSSSLRSLDSPESSPFMFNIPATSQIPEVPPEAHNSLQPIPSTSAIQQVLQSLQAIQSASNPLQEAMQSLQQVPTTITSPLQQAMQSLQQVPSTTSSSHQQAMHSLQLMQSTTSPHQQAMQAFALSRNIHLPTQEIEDAAMTRAILAVLTSPSSSTSSSTPNLPYNHYRPPVRQQRDSAFKSYLAPQVPTRESLRRLSMLKRAITYYRSLHIVRRGHMMANRPTDTQLHHMISERRRREKINDSFEALRKLLPPEAKKDKASVLTRTREYLTLLKSEVAELSQRNQQLEEQLSSAPRQVHAEEVIGENKQLESSNERFDVRIINVSSESTSEEDRIVNLQVVLRGETPVSHLIIRILEFLKQVNNINLMSVEANTSSRAESRSWSRVILRLRIEGGEWDEAAFEEAVRRVIADLLH